MKRFVCTLAGLMLTLGIASQAKAQSAIELNGSDTLYNMTNYLLNTHPGECGGDDPANPSDDYIVYMGGGSSTGENAMKAGTQDVAPMSRSLKSSACDADPSYINTAEAYGHSLDAISIYRSGNSLADEDMQCQPDANCESIANDEKSSATNVLDVQDLNGIPGLQCPGCDGNGKYAFANDDGKDVLAVLYAGRHHDGTIDCASDVRYTLAGLPQVDAQGELEQSGGYENQPLDCENDCWENNFMKDSEPFVDCTDEKCNMIWHLWRRGDLSGTTDTFKGLLSIKTEFCNGDEGEDNDPIRRPVHDWEDIPGRKDLPMMVSKEDNECAPESTADVEEVTGVATLGLVLPVVVPPPFEHNTNECASGVFGWYNVPFQTRPTCEDGAGSVFGLCLLPEDANGVPGCINMAGNYSMFTPLDSDTRSTNMVQRDRNGVIVPDELGDDVMHAYYNINARTTISDYVTPCNHDNSTDQIACLAVASPCSIGYAGMGGTVSVPAAMDLEVNGVKPEVPQIRSFDYPLTRYLWLNSLVGFDAAEENQSDLAKCFGDRYYVDAAATASGFVTLDDNTPTAPDMAFVPVTDPCL